MAKLLTGSIDLNKIDKTKIIDRALKLEQLKAKISDDEWGSGFMMDEDDDTDK